jgi:hypothetical protein
MQAVPVLDPYRPLWRAIAALCAIAILAMLGLFALRIGYPCELEWMEGAMVDEAARMRHGLSSYHAPTTQHVPFLYTPLFYAMGALASFLVGEGFFAVRLVSVLSTIACMALLASIVYAETEKRRAALCAAGLFAAGYGWLRAWYDLGRNDMLFLACMLATWRLLITRTDKAAWFAAACAVLAFCAKQTALMWLPALAIAALLLDVRRGAKFSIAAALGIGLLVYAYDAATDGWFSFYVFAMPRAHHWQGDKLLGFWTEDLIPVLPLLVLALCAFVQRWSAKGPRQALALGAAIGGGVVASYVSRLHVGGFDNVLIYGFAALCAVGPVAAVLCQSPGLRRIATALLALQFAMLVLDVRSLSSRPLLYDPSRCLPRAGHEAACTEIRDFVRAQPGPVWLPFQGWLAVEAGKEPSAHGQAVVDLLAWIEQPGLPPDDRAAVALLQSLKSDLEGKRYAAIVLQEPQGAKFTGSFGPFLAGYRLRDGALLSDPMAIRPLVGMHTHTPFVLERRP